jgi:hypothetical protein
MSEMMYNDVYLLDCSGATMLLMFDDSVATIMFNILFKQLHTNATTISWCNTSRRIMMFPFVWHVLENVIVRLYQSASLDFLTNTGA